MMKTRIITCLWFCIVIFLVPILASATEKGLTSNKGKIVTRESEQTRCYQFPSYYVIEKKHNNGVGSDFLVKFKTAPENNPQCSYALERGDFEITGEWAAYFWTIKSNLLFLEHYTGPAPWVFSIWDLTMRKKVFESSCNAPVDFQGNSILYWLETGVATTENCPQLSQFEAHGLGGAIETRVVLDLSDFKISETDETRCSARQ